MGREEKIVPRGNGADMQEWAKVSVGGRSVLDRVYSGGKTDHSAN